MRTEYVSDVVTTIRARARPHLYIKEWMDHLGLSDETVGLRLDYARQTIYRWRTQQHRLNPQKISALAGAMGCTPQDLWRQPSRPSIDAMTERLPDELHGDLMEIARHLTKRAS